MAGASGLKTALFLGLLMVLGGPLNTMMLDHPASAPTPILGEMNVASAMAGENASFLLPGNNLPSTSFTVDVPSDAPVTSIHLEMQPTVQPTQTGFVWNDNTAWSASTATHNGTFGSDGNLTGDGGGTLWDFNSGLQGWTVSASTYVGRYTGTGAGSGAAGCGYNGTAGGSIKTQAQSTPEHATNRLSISLD